MPQPQPEFLTAIKTGCCAEGVSVDCGNGLACDMPVANAHINKASKELRSLMFDCEDMLFSLVVP